MRCRLMWFGGARGYHRWRSNTFKHPDEAINRIRFFEQNDIKWSWVMV